MKCVPFIINGEFPCPGATRHYRTTPLTGDLWHLPTRFCLRFIVPLICLLIARDFKAYTYLPQSTPRFIPAGELAQCMVAIGFKEVYFRRFMGE